MKYLCIIQARIGSTRFPNKVMQTVGGKTLVKRVWEAAKGCRFVDKVIVAWPERYPALDENNVLERFRRIATEFPTEYIIRLTSDCPLLTSRDINNAILMQQSKNAIYYSNRKDGHDVQIFKSFLLFDSLSITHYEHVIADFSTPSTGLSVNTREDLERVRSIHANR